MVAQSGSRLPHADELISMRVAILATQRFLELFWERGEKRNEEIGMLLSAMDMAFFADGGPVDLAQWQDFVAARDDVAERLAS